MRAGGATTVSRAYGLDGDSPGRIRRWAVENLESLLPAECGQTGVIDEAELIVSELLTNALLTHCTRVVLDLCIDDERIRVEVFDDAPGRPTLLRAAVDDERGRGIAIVAELSSDWGVQPVEHGKKVWAELLIHDDGTSAGA